LKKRSEGLVKVPGTLVSDVVVGHATCFSFSSMRRLTVVVVGHASCYSFSNMRRITVVGLSVVDVEGSKAVDPPLKVWMGAEDVDGC
jgi:hypothetical protein